MGPEGFRITGYHLLFDLNLFNDKEFVITVRELRVIAIAANIGLIYPVAATGISIILYINARNRFCFILLIVA